MGFDFLSISKKKMKTKTILSSLLGLSSLIPVAAQAASLNGSELSLAWAIPFAGILLCIALCPLLCAHFWHHNFGKVAVGWALACAIPLFLYNDFQAASGAMAHAMLGDYVPFIIFVGTLFIVAGGIHIRSSFAGTPIFNAAVLVVGAFMANLMGTTGAAMLLIRPLLKANENRQFKMHTFIFFIFLVANIGGCLTPLGDPPLFLGFLRGVDFFWTVTHMLMPLVVATAILVAIYLVIDTYFYKKEDMAKVHSGEKAPFKIEGGINFLFLAGVIGAVLLSGFWKSGVHFEFMHVHFSLEALCRDAIFITIAILSLVMTPKAAREGNQFTWDPILEVAKLFFGIFVCIVPVLEMLRAGEAGAFAPLVALVTNADGTYNNEMFFWMTGTLSGFLDNAPTYLAFFNLAGGDPAYLMGEGATTLTAISMGAVFMGALSYIGNAPNFMTVAIVQERGVKMPSFFGYMIWSVALLLPTFYICTKIFL
jgi:Na+/H+ antiporter NhaD/arsenite permease-like protein